MAQRQDSMELPPEHPQRMSALYQYHNAPEVAPAHGLEYDDSNYPQSDKYPVIHTMPAYDPKWTAKDFSHDNRPPRIIFGMKVRTFLAVAAIMVMVIVGAAVGGAVGGSTIKGTSNTNYMSTGTNTTSTTTASNSGTPSATPSTYAAPSPTYAPLSDCPAANNTVYTSSFSSGMAGSVASATKLDFTRYCNFANPLSNSSTQLGTFVYSFEDCIEACAALNFYNNNGSCQLAAFKADAARPVNCWVGQYNRSLAGLSPQDGTAVALLHT